MLVLHLAGPNLPNSSGDAHTMQFAGDGGGVLLVAAGAVEVCAS